MVHVQIAVNGLLKSASATKIEVSNYSNKCDNPLSQVLGTMYLPPSRVQHVKCNAVNPCKTRLMFA